MLRDQTAQLEQETQLMAANLMKLKQKMKQTKKTRPQSGSFWKENLSKTTVGRRRINSTRAVHQNAANATVSVGIEMQTAPDSPPPQAAGVGVSTSVGCSPIPFDDDDSTGPVDMGVGHEDAGTQGHAPAEAQAATGSMFSGSWTFAPVRKAKPAVPKPTVTTQSCDIQTDGPAGGMSKPAGSYFDQLVSAAIMRKLEAAEGP